MKHLFILLLSCIPMFSTAQTLTETQKQEALQSANNFCNLLKRFYEGERTLDTQIYGLCSGSDISAYDEIKTNSEKTIKNYLLAIQTKHPRGLTTSISSPALSSSKTYIEPVVGLSVGWGDVNGADMSTTQMLSVTQENVANIYVVFDITQGFPSLGKNINKKLIYSLKTKKIVAFITSNGSYINFLNGTMAVISKDYKNALHYFEAATGNARSSLSKKSYGLALYCCIMLQDYEKAVIYAEKYNDPLYLSFMKTMYFSLNEKIEEAHTHAIQLENILSQRNDIPNVSRTNMYKALATVFLTPSSYQNLMKGLSYLKKADVLGDAGAGYQIFVYWTIFHDDFIPIEDAFTYLEKSANGGFPPAFYQMGRIAEYGTEDKEKALSWYLKAAQAGNHIGMAGAGKLLIEKGEKQRGIDLLKKALNGDTLEKQLYDCEMTTGGLPPWPKSRTDVQTLMNKYNAESSNTHTNTTTTNVSTFVNTPINSNTINNGNTNVHNTSSSYSNRRKYRRPFNCPYENYHQAGFSIGYVQKQWAYETEDGTEKYGYWEDSKAIHGIQAGFRIEPLFKYGFGLDTGLYYEFYYSKSKALDYEGEEYKPSLEEHVLYLPVHLEYRLNFSKNFQLFFYGGVGLDYGLSAKIKTNNDNLDYDENNAYKNSEWKRFNASLEYGGGMRICNIQINFTMANGLINMSEDSDYKVKQNKNLMCILSAML